MTTTATKTQTKKASKKTYEPAAELAEGQGHRNTEKELRALHITKLVKDNPRREGSWGFKSFSVITNGMSVQNYLDKGGRMRDLRWDIAHGFVKVG